MSLKTLKKTANFQLYFSFDALVNYEGYYEEKQEHKKNNNPIEISDKTWFLLQNFIKNSRPIQSKINYAKKRSSGLEHHDFENCVLILCIETIQKCLEMSPDCNDSEKCVICPIFECKLQEKLSSYLDQNTRNLPISYANKPFSNYENSTKTCSMPEAEKIFEETDETETETHIECLEDLIEKFSPFLNKKELLILELLSKGYKPKSIAKFCNYTRVQSVYISIKRLTNKIKVNINNLSLAESD